MQWNRAYQASDVAVINEYKVKVNGQDQSVPCSPAEEVLRTSKALR